MRCIRLQQHEDKENDFSIHAIPFLGDSRPEAIERRQKWISFVNLTRRI